MARQNKCIIIIIIYFSVLPISKHSFFIVLLHQRDFQSENRSDNRKDYLRATNVRRKFRRLPARFSFRLSSLQRAIASAQQLISLSECRVCYNARCNVSELLGESGKRPPHTEMYTLVTACKKTHVEMYITQPPVDV